MLWRQSPTQTESEDCIVSKWNEIVKNPEAWSLMAMEKVLGGDVLNCDISTSVLLCSVIKRFYMHRPKFVCVYMSGRVTLSNMAI